ncbi:MAG TPA: hypothetical protein VF017_15720 [Thermoanaerobaculia bacterium]|nr:hypothetical protein [Thermoanaerobaculia bacterium]
MSLQEEFANRVQAETHAKLQEYLRELFDDAYQDTDTHHFYLRYGTTVLEISNEPYGPEDSVVTIMAYCVQGVTLEKSLLLTLLELNHDLAFGAFSVVGHDVFFSHSLFGRTLCRDNLLNAISAVANFADDYDDRISARYGGQTALDRIRDTGGLKRRSARQPEATR